MMFSNIYSMLLSLIVGALSARFLGPSNYGLLNYGSSIISFFTTISRLGMDSVIVAEMVKNPEKENTYLGTALVMRFFASVISFVGVWGIVLVLEPGNTLLQAVTLLQAIAIIFQCTEVLNFWFNAHLEMKYVTITKIIALTLTAVWRISLLARPLRPKVRSMFGGIHVLQFLCIYSTGGCSLRHISGGLKTRKCHCPRIPCYIHSQTVLHNSQIGHE